MLIQSARLRIIRLASADAEFILALLNDPDWLRYIGDRGVHDLDSARSWIETGPRESYRRNGFGLYRVALAADDTAIGTCGLLQRANLDSPDLGFALLPAFRGRGYALEAATAVIEQARSLNPRPSQLYAFLTAENSASSKLLRRLGFLRVGEYRLAGDDARLDLYRYRI